eukprot:m.109861 g.109861  ORF g.109861 m.109861 type:complete len:938 (+) comp12856_c0_seq1:339-3152(+)
MSRHRHFKKALNDGDYLDEDDYWDEDEDGEVGGRVGADDFSSDEDTATVTLDDHAFRTSSGRVIVQPTGGAPAQPAVQWQCTACTFTNFGEGRRCEMCETPRAEHVTPKVVAQKAKSVGSKAAYDDVDALGRPKARPTSTKPESQQELPTHQTPDAASSPTSSHRTATSQARSSIGAEAGQRVDTTQIYLPPLGDPVDLPPLFGPYDSEDDLGIPKINPHCGMLNALRVLDELVRGMTPGNINDTIGSVVVPPVKRSDTSPPRPPPGLGPPKSGSRTRENTPQQPKSVKEGPSFEMYSDTRSSELTQGLMKQASTFGRVLCRQHRTPGRIFPEFLGAVDTRKLVALDRPLGSKRKEMFSFDVPSPDGVVLAAQARTRAGVPQQTDPPSRRGLTAGEKKAQETEADSMVQEKKASANNARDFNIDAPQDVLQDQQQPRRLHALDISASEETDGAPVDGGAAAPPKPLAAPGPSVSGDGDEVEVVRTLSGGRRKRGKIVDVKSAFKENEATRKAPLGLVVLGHVDAGKSTLMGHLLHLCGLVNQRQMHKYTTMSEKAGKGSFKYAWVLDDTEQERERGVTIDVAQAYFETSSKGVTILDAPGHKDFLPNAIMGVAEADAAVLVIDATRGEFETGFGKGGQTREHAIVARSLGIKHMVVAINKLDMVEWNQGRFDEVRDQLLRFLQSVGFNPDCVHFVPTSGFHGHNISVAPPPECDADWYSGPPLVECIDRLPPRQPLLDAPLRVSVSNVFKAAMGVGTSVSGRVLQGCVQVGEGVVVMPSKANGMIKTIAVGNEPQPWAVGGDSVVLSVSGTDRGQIAVGSIICAELCPISVATAFEAQIVTFDMDVPITKGHSVLVYFHQRAISGTVKKLLATLDKKTREPVGRKPRLIKSNSSALVRIQTDQSVCVSAFAENKLFGRFVVRYSGMTIAAGIVTQLL